jgi:hypothetical protein
MSPPFLCTAPPQWFPAHEILAPPRAERQSRKAFDRALKTMRALCLERILFGWNRHCEEPKNAAHAPRYGDEAIQVTARALYVLLVCFPPGSPRGSLAMTGPSK